MLALVEMKSLTPQELLWVAQSIEKDGIGLQNFLSSPKVFYLRHKKGLIAAEVFGEELWVYVLAGEGITQSRYGVMLALKDEAKARNCTRISGKIWDFRLANLYKRRLGGKTVAEIIEFEV